MSCNGNCGVPYTNVVTTNAEEVNDFNIVGNNFTILRVFTWKNTSTVGDFTDNWQSSSAWEPYRNNPSVNDVLVFSKGGTVTPLNIPTETAKRIIIRNNTIVNVNTNSLTNESATLTVGNGTGDDYEIEAGSALNVTSTGNTLSIVIPSVSTAGIAGDINFSGKNHSIRAVGELGITFKNGSKFTDGAGLFGNPIGNSVNISVLFESGSILEDQVGLDYFSNTNVLNFNSNSLYIHASVNTVSLDNKTIQNLERQIMQLLILVILA